MRSAEEPRPRGSPWCFAPFSRRCSFTPPTRHITHDRKRVRPTATAAGVMNSVPAPGGPGSRPPDRAAGAGGNLSAGEGSSALPVGAAREARRVRPSAPRVWTDAWRPAGPPRPRAAPEHARQAQKKPSPKANRSQDAGGASPSSMGRRAARGADRPPRRGRHSRRACRPTRAPVKWSPSPAACTVTASASATGPSPCHSPGRSA